MIHGAFPWSSRARSTSSSILRPSTPPARLISPAPNWMPSSVGSEYGFAGPTLSVITPILMLSWGTTAVENAASVSVVSLRTARKETYSVASLGSESIA